MDASSAGSRRPDQGVRQPADSCAFSGPKSGRICGAATRKHLTNIVKMVAYQAESDLLAFLRPQYARAEDEGRTLLHELFRTVADIAIVGDVLIAGSAEPGIAV
jgi:hypothetical protein